MNAEKKDSTNNVISMTRQTGETLTDAFKHFIAKNDSTENILRFLSITDAQYIAKCSRSEVFQNVDIAFSKEEREELYDFYSYFMENYGEETEEARYANWGREAFVFRLADELYNLDCEKADQEFMETVSDEVIEEARSFTEKIFAIRKDKHFACTTETDIWEFDILHTIPKKYLQGAKDKAIVSFSKIIAQKGAIVARIFTSGKPDQMFGIKGTGTSWKPISKDEMRSIDLEAMQTYDVPEILEYIELKK